MQITDEITSGIRTDSGIVDTRHGLRLIAKDLPKMHSQKQWGIVTD